MASRTDAIRDLLHKVEIHSDVTASDLGRAALADIRRELDELDAQPQLLAVYLRDGALVWMSGTTQDSPAAAQAMVDDLQRLQPPGFATSYRIAQLATVAHGEWLPFVGAAAAAPSEPALETQEGPTPEPAVVASLPEGDCPW